MALYPEPIKIKKTTRRVNYRGEAYNGMLENSDASGSMTVTVLYNGLPISGAQVFLYNMDTGELISKGLSDSAGQVHFTSLDAKSPGAGKYFAVSKVGTVLNLQVTGRL